ncbi:hypothetical protein ElyMa_000007300 [Elysia marginata]|uniref:Uncharacterized protein n=1 Tax=Elysia marginata TaxID=1093978 RepID=A0AAV4EAH5_9GAST|nr:hypothetical protein ElyMa_000007300 [Elysia marginata]
MWDRKKTDMNGDDSKDAAVDVREGQNIKPPTTMNQTAFVTIFAVLLVTFAPTNGFSKYGGHFGKYGGYGGFGYGHLGFGGYGMRHGGYGLGGYGIGGYGIGGYGLGGYGLGGYGMGGYGLGGYGGYGGWGGFGIAPSVSLLFIGDASAALRGSDVSSIHCCLSSTIDLKLSG